MANATTVNPARVAKQFQALADETRLKVLRILTRGEQCVCVLVTKLDIPQPLLSHHLKTLREAGFITARREGRWMYYALRPEALDDCGGALTGLLDAYQESARLGRPGCYW